MFSHGSGYSDGVIDTTYYRLLMTDGVGLFFVLSGFLIGGILIKKIQEKPFTLGELFHFWVRRWFRTLPAYYLVLAVLLVCYYFVHYTMPPQWSRYIIFMQNFAWPHPLFFGEAWSLAVEEWFYLLVPAGLCGILYFVKHRRLSYVLFWILLVLMAGTLIRVVKLSQPGFVQGYTIDEDLAKQVITRMDSIMYGMLGAWIYISKPASWIKYKTQLFIVGLLLLFVPNIGFGPAVHVYVRPSILSIGALCLLPMLNSIVHGRGIVYRAVTFISTISYSMYLTNHMIVYRGVMPIATKYLNLVPAHNANHSTICLILYWVITILLSYILYRCWEQPVMRLRDRWKP
jgi:peptidoglycan/LPS O-acetylase OafA/YrhL